MSASYTPPASITKPKRVLDLGCGTAKVPGAIGVERVLLNGVDVVAELDVIPYPFANSSFDEVHLNDVIEHLPSTIKAMEEIYRITKPNGHVFIRVIDWSSDMNATDPQHVRQFTEHTFDYFGTLKDRNYYSHARFKVISVKKEYNRAVERRIKSKTILQFLSRYLNNIVDGLHFDLQALKPANTLPEPVKNASLIDLLRCPKCLVDGKNEGATLRPLNATWLTCLSCDRKYPMQHGAPFLRYEDGDRWRAVPATSLPSVLPKEYAQFEIHE
jgi:SAM-dependent methyltransferase